ncbi:MAG: hypothetical protein K9N47_04755 [Prosthecobacter sp.]|uniref:hypothetical protein n=1 Tax=Prosthecobacter sp. TaxID=1965333 RepID=UPI0025ED1E4C|nr:hypothetical protein [Prosthecobacter sp.]MCF7785408.1 hypothetical protein [Prosthecobacter sp.]
MKTRFRTLCLSAFCASTALLLTQCASPRTETVRAASPTPTGGVTVKALGDTTVATRRLIHHPLTNKDIGKVYEEITLVSPRGTSVQERVIVRALPKLETNVVTK